MQIITGKTDTAHVRSEDDRALHAGTFGTGAYILNVGSKLSATIETANNIVIADGELMFQGTHARIRYGETETCIIENGTTGYNRIDLIVARYTQTAGLEQMELAVIKGEATAAEPKAPAYTAGNILEGATLAEIPLYAVRISGVNVISVTSQLPVLTTTMDNTYTKSEVYNKGETYTKTEVNTIMGNIYTKSEVYNKGETYTKTEVDTSIEDLGRRIESAESGLFAEIESTRNSFNAHVNDIDNQIAKIWAAIG